jgi:hypothetical protein
MSRLRKITRNSGEKTTAVDKLRLALKSASAKSLVNDRSQVRAVTCHLNDDADKRQASEQSKRINRVKLHGVAVGAKRRRRTNDVIILSSSSSSPSSVANFHVTANERNSIKKTKAFHAVGLQQKGVERRESVVMELCGAWQMEQ